MREVDDLLVAERVEEYLLPSPNESDLLEKVQQEINDRIEKVEGFVQLLSEGGLEIYQNKFLHSLQTNSSRLKKLFKWHQRLLIKHGSVASNNEVFQDAKKMIQNFQHQHFGKNGIQSRFNWQLVGFNQFENLQLKCDWTSNMLSWLTGIISEFIPDKTLLVVAKKTSPDTMEDQIEVGVVMLFKDGVVDHNQSGTKRNFGLDSKIASGQIDHLIPRHLLEKWGSSTIMVYSNYHSLHLKLLCPRNQFRLETKAYINAVDGILGSPVFGQQELMYSYWVTFGGIPVEQEELIRVSLPSNALLVDSASDLFSITKNLPLIIFESVINSETRRAKWKGDHYSSIRKISCFSLDDSEFLNPSADALLVWPFDRQTLLRVLRQVHQ